MGTENNDNWAKGPSGWIITIVGSILSGLIIMFMTSASASQIKTESRITALETANLYQKQSVDTLINRVDTMLKVQLYKASGMSIEAIRTQIEGK